MQDEIEAIFPRRAYEGDGEYLGRVNRELALVKAKIRKHDQEYLALKQRVGTPVPSVAKQYALVGGRLLDRQADLNRIVDEIERRSRERHHRY